MAGRRSHTRDRQSHAPGFLASVAVAAVAGCQGDDDPDTVEPAGKVWLHWLVWNVPGSRTGIPEDWTPETAVEGTNESGSRGYSGPAPPDGTHTYRFKLYRRS